MLSSFVYTLCCQTKNVTYNEYAGSKTSFFQLLVLHMTSACKISSVLLAQVCLMMMMHLPSKYDIITFVKVATNNGIVYTLVSFEFDQLFQNYKKV